MTNRILDFSGRPLRLFIEHECLVVADNQQRLETIPCSDIAAILLSNRDVSLTQSVLGDLTRSGAIVVCCDRQYKPVGMMLPLDAHHRQAARFQLQPLLSRPRQKRLWQQIVQSKITAQARVLTEVQGEDAGLTALAGQVRSGDPNNVEARAARRYWLRLFGDAAFTRQSEFDARNHWLNYGYAVLRAMTSRAICGAGLHPSFGIAHKCASNPFALADDLMEPFRPIIDLVVVRSVGNPPAAVDKSRLLEAVTGRFHADHESRLLFDILARLAQSMAAVVLGEADTLWLPAVSSMEGDHRVSGTLVPKGPASDTALATRRRSVL